LGPLLGAIMYKVSSRGCFPFWIYKEKKTGQSECVAVADSWFDSTRFVRGMNERSVKLIDRVDIVHLVTKRTERTNEKFSKPEQLKSCESWKITAYWVDVELKESGKADEKIVRTDVTALSEIVIKDLSDITGVDL